MSLGINIAPLIGLLSIILGGCYMWHLIHIETEDEKKRGVMAVKLTITGILMIFIGGLATGTLNEWLDVMLIFGKLFGIIGGGGLLGAGFEYATAYFGKKKPDTNKAFKDFGIGCVVTAFALIIMETAFSLHIICGSPKC